MRQATPRAIEAVLVGRAAGSPAGPASLLAILPNPLRYLGNRSRNRSRLAEMRPRPDYLSSSSSS